MTKPLTKEERERMVHFANELINADSQPRRHHLTLRYEATVRAAEEQAEVAQQAFDQMEKNVFEWRAKCKGAEECVEQLNFERNIWRTRAFEAHGERSRFESLLRRARPYLGHEADVGLPELTQEIDRALEGEP